MFKRVALQMLNTFGWLVIIYVVATTVYLVYKDYQMYQLAYVGQVPELYKVFVYYYTCIKILETGIIIYEYNLLSCKKNRGLLILFLFLLNFLILDLPVIIVSGDTPGLFRWGLPVLIYIICTLVFVILVKIKRR